MSIRGLKFRDFMLPLLVLAFVGLAVTFLTPIFNTTTRWAILGIVFLYLLLSSNLFKSFGTSFDLLALAMIVWCFGSVIWSDLPLLSFMKAAAFFMVVFTCMAAGNMWVRQHAPQDSLKYLFPLTVTALMAGILGKYSAQAVSVSGSTTMYQGLVEGSNMFGSMMAMCSPFLLWQTYRYWKNTRKRIFWMTLLSVNFFFLLAAVSRGAILVALCTALGLFLCLGTTRRTHILVLFFGVILGSFLLVPGQFEQFQNKYLHKLAATEEQGVLHTREMVWKESYEQAKKGGWLGGGYGVTIGDTDFKGGFTTIGYGREKGNTQLAIIEETGLIGLAIYLAALIALFTKLGRTALRLPKGPEKVLLSIVTGNLFGMTIMSVFEAWWVAPSSPESVYFWALAGVALGLARIKPAPARLTHQAGKVPTRRMVPSSSSRRTASA